MHYLAIVSIIWAFSFGLIGNALREVDPIFVATVRLGIAGLVFLPFLRIPEIPKGSARHLLFCGAVQFGVMYVSYIQAFQYLPSHLVALFSIMTPLYVVLIHDARTGHFKAKHLAAACLSILGAAIVKTRHGTVESFWLGFGLMQIAGIAFAFGQVDYRQWKRNHPTIKDHHIFALLYAGGFSIALIASLFFTDWHKVDLDPGQIAMLSYLGVIASGLGFFLWNKGGTLCRAGTLAAFNNAVVPLAMACSLFIFGEIAKIEGGDLLRLLFGSTCIFTAILVAEKSAKKH
jgi:drug/metabolite transporter (DMT)-like permease